jgi:hypothetical protein
MLIQAIAPTYKITSEGVAIVIPQQKKQSTYRFVMFYFTRVRPTYDILTKNAKHNTRKIID